MASGFPRSPKLLKGGLVVYESHTPGPPPQVIVFQYNPEQLTRNLSNRTQPPDDGGNIGGAQEDALRVFGPPEETLKLSIILDAADYLETPDQHPEVARNGLYPVLSVLEMLLYPSTMRFSNNQSLAAQGEVQVVPEDLPLTLLVLGEARVAPVSITSFAITEEAFDPRLNPIRAKVELGLQVLTYLELPQDSQGRHAYITYQTRKEQFAEDYESGNVADELTELATEAMQESG